MLNSISRACIQQAVHAGSLYVTTTISVLQLYHHGCRDYIWVPLFSFPRIQSNGRLIRVTTWTGRSTLATTARTTTAGTTKAGTTTARTTTAETTTAPSVTSTKQQQQLRVHSTKVAFTLLTQLLQGRPKALRSPWTVI